MIFNSLTYFLFLPTIYLFFYISPDRFRWLVLLLASFVFYGALKAPYLLAVLGVVTVFTYMVGRQLGTCSNQRQKLRLFWFGVATNILILAAIKYFPFLARNVSAILGTMLPAGQIFVSIGVSYYVFQAISYLADIYLEIIAPEQHLGYFALYLALFPKILQGPIERADSFLPQLKQPYRFDYDNMRSGMLLFTWGLFKKVVVADRLGFYADQVFNNVHGYTGLALIIGIYAYAFQIYFDFSGYTDMARGTGRLFGINLTENFNRPYLATSIADFWRRWHISFSRWILDYIFRPLQMRWRDRGQAGMALALIITFLVSGIWHGATWGYVIWGLLHGIYLAASTYYRPYKKTLHKYMGVEKSRWLKWWQVLVTFNLVSFAWVFFRAKSLEDAGYIVRNLFDGIGGADTIFASRGPLENAIMSFVFLIVVVVTILRARLTDVHSFFQLPFIYRWLTYILLPTVILLFYIDKNHTFIYLNF